MATSSVTKPNDTSNSTASRESAHPVADKVRETLHESVDAVAQKSAEFEKNVRQTAGSSAHAAAEKREQIESKWNNSAVKKYAVENPVATAGLAFVAGALLTSILRK